MSSHNFYSQNIDLNTHYVLKFITSVCHSHCPPNTFNNNKNYPTATFSSSKELLCFNAKTKRQTEREISWHGPFLHITSPPYIQHSPVRHAGLISYAIFLGSTTQLQIPVGLHLPDKKSFPCPHQRHLPVVRMAAIAGVLLRAALVAVP